MMPVVLAQSGVPVISVPARGYPAIVAANGRGVPIVLVEANGVPMVISGLPEPEEE